MVEKLKILIVDEEPHVVKLVRLSLGDKYAFYEAHNIQSAIFQYNKHKPDLVITELVFEDDMSPKTLVRLKEDNKEMLIFVLSSRYQIMDKFSAISQGAIDFMQKPFDPIDLEKRVDFLLRFVKHSCDKSKNMINYKEVSNTGIVKCGYCGEKI